jgi:hypothetical protein
LISSAIAFPSILAAESSPPATAYSPLYTPALQENNNFTKERRQRKVEGFHILLEWKQAEIWTHLLARILTINGYTTGKV